MKRLLLKHRPYLTPGVFLIIGLVGTVLYANHVTDNNRQAITRAVESKAERMVDDVIKRMMRYQYGLRGARGAVVTAGPEGITRELFHRYWLSRDSDLEFPGARGFGFIRRVPVAEQAAFVERARLDAFPSFDIRQLARHSGERFVIQYVEPVSDNEQAVGLDIASESNRRKAAFEAMRSGEIRFSGPITLVQAAGDHKQSLLMLMPIYHGVVTPATVAEREKLAYGWSYAPLLMNEVLASIEINADFFSLAIRDVTNTDDSVTLFSSQNKHDDPKDLAGALNHYSTRTIYGRDWGFDVHAYPAFVQSLGLLAPRTVYITGSLIAILGALLFCSLGKIFGLRQESTRQQQLLGTMVETSPDALITCDLDGRVTSWNRSAQTLFGFSSSEAVGSLASALILPDDLQHEEESIRQLLEQHQAVPHYMSRRYNKDRHLVDVSISVAPLIEGGQMTGYSTTIRDISEQVAAQREVFGLNKNLELLVAERTQELKKSKRTLQSVLDNIPSTIGYWDADLRLITANRAALSHFNAETVDEVRGRGFEELSQPEGYAHTGPYVQEVLSTGQAVSAELEGTGVNNEPVCVALHVVPEKERGQVTGLYVITHDLTEIRQHRQQLASAVRENEALLATINEQMLYSTTDRRGVIIDVNDNFCRVSGYQREALIGQDHRLLSAKVHSKDFWREMWQTIHAGQPWHGEICNRDSKGELKWFDTVIAPFVGVDGSIERYVSLRTDITDKRAAEAERNRTSLLLESVLDAASEIAVIATDTQGVMTMFNSGAEKMLGYSADEVVNQQTPAIFHVEQEIIERGEQLSQRFGQDIRGFDTFVYMSRVEGSEVRLWTYLPKGGGKLTVSLAVTTMRDSDNAIIGYLGVAQDITEQERSRRDLLSVRDQLSIAADVAKLGIWSLDMQTMTLRWNERMFELYDFAPTADGCGPDFEQWFGAVHPDDLAAVRASIDTMLEGNAANNNIFRIIHASGKILTLHGSAQIERDNYGEIISVTGVNRDISDQQLLEAELRRAKELSDSASAAKSAFLANMSHEIRTPMNAVLGMLQLVSKTRLDERQHDYVGKATLAAKSLLSLLNDILDFSKIEADKLVLERSVFGVEELLRDTGVVLSGYQRQENVELMFDIDAALPQQLIGDRLRLQQLLLNLGGNALKFTEQGLVVIRLQQLQRAPGSVKLRISVEDSGIGIKPDQLAHIFDDFVQAEASTTRRFGGTGLGLVICKRLVDLLGSELHVESEYGKGSRFWFDLTAEVENEALLVPEGPSAKILIVEDSHLVAEILGGMLGQLGYQFDIAHSAAVAVGLVQTAHKLNGTYDLILMDWQLPDLSGLEAAEFIAGCYSSNDASAAPPKVIILTAHAQKFAEIELSSPDKHYHGLLVKPVTPLQLNEAISRVLNNQDIVDTNSAELERLNSRKLLTNLRLLVVEDNALNRQVASELLAEEGARVELAEGGLEGVDKVLNSHVAYDLVIMDVQMPDIDGLEATRRIRASGRFDALPILAMTANASASDRDDCLAAGMNEHVGKPIDMAVLVPMIVSLIGNDDSADNSTATSTEPSSVEPLSVEPSSTVASPAINQSQRELLKRFGSNTALFQKVQAKFHPEATQLLTQLEVALAEANRDQALLSLHSLKGISATMGATALAALAAEFEARLKAGATLDSQDWLEAVEIAQLQQLLESSSADMAALAAQLATASESELEPAQDLPTEELKRQLQHIVELLAADNLAVLDSIESLYRILSPDQQQQLELLKDHIGALEFAEATAAIQTLLKDL